MTGRAFRAGASATFNSVVAGGSALAAAAPPTITGTGYLVGVPVPGILCTKRGRPGVPQGQRPCHEGPSR